MLKSAVDGFRGQRILEVGCGLGGFCFRMAREGANVVGLDISRTAVDEARNLANELLVRNRVDLIVGDAQHLPFREESSQIVVCSETLEHVPNYEKAFDELVRVAVKSGVLCITVPNILSSLLPEEIILLLVRQPCHARNIVNVETEHVFHIFKVKELLSKGNLETIDIRSTDFLHLPPRLRRFLKVDRSLKIASGQLEKFLEDHFPPLKLMGANIGVLAKKRL